MSTSDGLRLQRIVGDAEGRLRDLLLYLALHEQLVELVMILGEVQLIGKFETIRDAFP